jgi:hypothetical protein
MRPQRATTPPAVRPLGLVEYWQATRLDDCAAVYGTVIQLARLKWRLPVCASRPPELEHHSQVMNRFDTTKAHAVSRSIALCDKVYAPQGVTGESGVGGA